MNIKDYKTSYNEFHKIYRVEIKEHGKWSENTYGKKNFKFLIDNNLKTKDELRKYPYRPYIFHRVKWLFMALWLKIKGSDEIIKKFFTSGWGYLILTILGFLYFYIPHRLSISEQNNKPNVQPIKEELHMNKPSKETLELQVSSNDSLLNSRDSLSDLKP